MANLSSWRACTLCELINTVWRVIIDYMGSTSASFKLECAEWGTERSFYSVKENGREPAADTGGGGQMID